VPRILIIEDDERLGRLTAEYLRKNGLEVGVERDGLRGRERILAECPDLVVLDVMLPGEDGLSVCRAVRPSYAGPILMLTARGEELDQVLGLELGADDYVVKPVSPRLLLARIKALLRRPVAEPDRPGGEVEAGGVRVDPSLREASIQGQVLDLTTAEFDLLWALAARAGQPVTRDDLFQELRGIEYDGVDRSMDVRVSQLRRKLEAAGAHAGLIKTVRGTGYQLAAPSR